jgi:hypothetical protein
VEAASGHLEQLDAGRQVTRGTTACIALTLVLAAATTATAQQATPSQAPIEVPAADALQELVLKDGTRAYGRVEQVDGDRVSFRTTAGAVIAVERAQIVSVRNADGRIINGEFRPADPNPTRLFFAPTGRSLRRGETYLGVYEIVLPFVQVGITDRISIGGGTPLVFGFDGEHPFWITPKVQILNLPKTQLAGGIMHFMNVGDGSFGIAYGVVTQGSADSAVTLGAGYAYERYGENDGAGVAMLGGEHRVSRGVKVITENYVWSGGGIATAGVRWMGERLSADLALAVPLGAGEVVAFPIVNFVYSFKKR